MLANLGNPCRCQRQGQRGSVLSRNAQAALSFSPKPTRRHSPPSLSCSALGPPALSTSRFGMPKTRPEGNLTKCLSHLSWFLVMQGTNGSSLSSSQMTKLL